MILPKNNFYTFINFSELNEFEVQKVYVERNHIEVRKMMFDDNIISYQQHIDFVSNLKNDKSKIYLLVKRGSIYVGVYSIVNLSHQNGQGGFYLFEEARKNLLTIEFLYYTISFVFSNYPVSNINGFSLNGNKIVNKINRLLGFSDSVPPKSTEKYIYWEMDKSYWVNNICTKNDILDLVILSNKFLV